MTRYPHPDAPIAAWLADGPATLSSSRRAAVKSVIRTTRQAHVIVLPLPERRTLRLVLAAAAVLIAGLALAAFIGSDRLFTVVPDPTRPTSTPASSSPPDGPGTPGTAEIEGFARSFVVDYEIPDGLDLRLVPDPMRDEPRAVYFTLGGMPVYDVEQPDTIGPDPTPAGWPHALMIADVSAAMTHRTEPDLVFDDAASFLSGLDALDVTAVGPTVATTLGGRPALTADVAGWHVDGPFLDFVSHPNRVTVADISGAIIAVQVWAGTANDLREWAAEVQPFVESLRFREPEHIACWDGSAPLQIAPTGRLTLPGDVAFDYTLPAGFEPLAGTGGTAVGMAVGAEPLSYGFAGGSLLSAHGIVLVEVTGATRHTSGLRPEPPIGIGAAAFVAGLDASADFDVRDRGRVELPVGRAHALSIGMAPTAADDAWTHLDRAAGDDRLCVLDFVRPSRLIVFNLGERTLALQIWATSVPELEAWYPDAMAFAASLRFSEAAR